jgi:hypothetical protein
MPLVTVIITVKTISAIVNLCNTSIQKSTVNKGSSACASETILFFSNKMVLQLSDFASEITEDELRQFTSDYYIPLALHPEVPVATASIADFPEGKVGVYTRFFEFANQRVPISLFLCDLLNYYRLHISQLHCIGAAKITNFEVNCRY